VLNRADGDTSLLLAARVAEPQSGRVMEVWTTEPAVQLYTSVLSANPATERSGFLCLETQHYPDSINHPEFPSTVLRPGQTFRSTTEFRFSIK
jgi:aldose 1-epimerase